MRRKQHGLQFEDDVVVQLFHAGAELERDELLDLRKCIDFSIRRFPETQLPKPVDVQLTLQGGNAAKLERFRGMATGRDALRLYVVVKGGMKADEAARQIRIFCYVSARDGTFERADTLGIKLTGAGMYETFDIDDRIAHLRECEDPILSAERRRRGRIVSVGKGGSARVLDEDGKKTYRMRKCDVIARSHKLLLENAEDFMDFIVGREVSFIPLHDNALSVLFI